MQRGTQPPEYRESPGFSRTPTVANSPSGGSNEIVDVHFRSSWSAARGSGPQPKAFKPNASSKSVQATVATAYQMEHGQGER